MVDIQTTSYPSEWLRYGWTYVKPTGVKVERLIILPRDDFGVSGKDESYKVLYSSGRGFKTLQKPKLKDSFIDPRTGETINVDDETAEPSNIYCKSKGRGSALGSFSRSRYQLQRQLRLARPLGSSDDAIESYYRRNNPAKRQENSTSTSDSESDFAKSEISGDINHSPFNSLIANNRQKVKATRNSKLQNNVLISNLLSKGINASGLSSITEMPNSQYDDGDDEHDDDDDDDDYICDNKGNSSMTSFNSSFDVHCSGKKTMDSDNKIFDSDTHVKVGGVSTQEKVEQGRGFAFVDNSTKVLKESDNEYQMKISPRIIANFSNLDKQTKNSNEMSRRFGERFNKEGQLCDGIHNFGECLRQLNIVTTDSFEGECFKGSTSGHFVVKKDDFPPLRRNNAL